MQPTPDAPDLLAIDAGQSGIKLRHRAGGTVEDWAVPAIRTDLPLLPQLADVIARVGASGRRAELIGIGTTGLTSDADPTALLDAARSIGAASVRLAHDSITAYLGALGDARGAVVAAGTGVVTLAVGRERVARVDGWGYLIGDAGSGYSIGRAALDAVMRAHDRRGPATGLTEVALAEFPDLEAAYIELQSDPGRVRRIAAYSRPVAELADAGDAVAVRILLDAAAELAHSAASGLRAVDEDGADGTGRPHVHGIGGVFRSQILAEAFRAATLAELPAARVTIGAADPVDGAARLFDVAGSSALAAHVIGVTT